MATKLNPSKQLEAAARLAIVALAIGSAERIALARALNACVRPSNLKIAKPSGRRKQVYVVDHSMNCYCEACAVNRDLEAGACALQNGLIKSVGMLETWRWKDAYRVQWEEKSAAIARLSKCACGHQAEKHLEDANANLLKCQVEKCDCDHFKYEIPSNRRENGRKIGEQKAAA